MSYILATYLYIFFIFFLQILIQSHCEIDFEFDTKEFNSSLELNFKNFVFYLFLILLWVFRFAQRSLKDLGFEKSTMEDLILDNVHTLMATIEKNSTNGVIKNFSKYSSTSILNNIWSLIGGTR